MAEVTIDGGKTVEIKKQNANSGYSYTAGADGATFTAEGNNPSHPTLTSGSVIIPDGGTVTAGGVTYQNTSTGGQTVTVASDGTVTIAAGGTAAIDGVAYQNNSTGDQTITVNSAGEFTPSVGVPYEKTTLHTINAGSTETIGGKTFTASGGSVTLAVTEIFDGSDIFSTDGVVSAVAAGATCTVTVGNVDKTVTVDGKDFSCVKGTVLTYDGTIVKLTSGEATFSQKDAVLAVGDAVITNEADESIVASYVEEGTADIMPVGRCTVDLGTNADITIGEGLNATYSSAQSCLPEGQTQPATITVAADEDGIMQVTLTSGAEVRA